MDSVRSTTRVNLPRHWGWEDYQRLSHWCMLNCEGRYYPMIHLDLFTFELESDATLFALRWL